MPHGLDHRHFHRDLLADHPDLRRHANHLGNRHLHWDLFADHRSRHHHWHLDTAFHRLRRGMPAWWRRLPANTPGVPRQCLARERPAPVVCQLDQRLVALPEVVLEEDLAALEADHSIMVLVGT